VAGGGLVEDWGKKGVTNGRARTKGMHMWGVGGGGHFVEKKKILRRVGETGVCIRDTF